MMYPKVMIKRSGLSTVVIFTSKTKATVIDNFKGNIKGYSGKFNQNEFISIEELFDNEDVFYAATNAIKEKYQQDLTTKNNCYKCNGKGCYKCK